VSALEPGFYMATVEGVPNIPIMITDNSHRGMTTRLVPDSCQGTRGHAPEDITDARPLIVLKGLDDAPPDHFPRLVRFLRGGGWDFTADQIEAQTKPARIPEPGLWGVVEASYNDGARCYWTLSPDGLWHSVRPPFTGATFVDWDHLIDPTLIREGLS